MDNEINRIAVPLREEYFKRLSTSYSKGGKQFHFIEQFYSGSGNELLEKFWSPRSSSRLCFDLYSWMGSDPDFDFKQDVLSFGATVEVLEPMALRGNLISVINNLNSIYKIK